MYLVKVIGRVQWDNAGTSGLHMGSGTAAASVSLLLFCYYQNPWTHSKHSTNVSGYYHNYIAVQVVEYLAPSRFSTIVHYFVSDCYYAQCLAHTKDLINVLFV